MSAKTCGCMTPEQTGTKNGFRCEFHRIEYGRLLRLIRDLEDAKPEHRKWNPADQHTCGDCGVLEGEFHQPGCDMERCPFCLGQLISCGCACKHFYPTYDVNAEPTRGLPEDVYKNGLPPAEAKRWDQILKAKGLIPYIVSPNMCARCGELWPEMFMVDDWTKVIPADLQREMLCWTCYETVKGFVLAAKAKG